MNLHQTILLLIIFLIFLFSSCKNFVNPNEIEDANGPNSTPKDIINISQSLILHDTFSTLSAYNRQVNQAYTSHLYKPLIGPDALLRTWDQFGFFGGATNTSMGGTTENGKFGKGLQFNYTGDNGDFTSWRTQDTIAYEVGNVLRTSEGAIEFWYKPHFAHNEIGNQDYHIIGGVKDDINNPLDMGDEIPTEGYIKLTLRYYTFTNNNPIGFYNQWILTLSEWDSTLGWTEGGAFSVLSGSSPVIFNANEWIHVAFAYKTSGIESLGGKTILIFLNGEEVGSWSSVLNFSHLHFPRHLIFGGNASGFLSSSSHKHGNGSSGDFDNIKIWNYAKTDFSDRNVE